MRAAIHIISALFGGLGLLYLTFTGQVEFPTLIVLLAFVIATITSEVPK